MYKFLFGQSCLCATFTSWSTPSFGMLLSKLPHRNTRVYIQYQNDQFFYTSVWIVHKLQCFKYCQPCVRTDKGKGGGQPNVDRPGREREGPKNSQICADILYGWPPPRRWRIGLMIWTNSKFTILSEKARSMVVHRATQRVTPISHTKKYPDL